jgi:hypothetical protein
MNEAVELFYVPLSIIALVKRIMYSSEQRQMRSYEEEMTAQFFERTA